MGDNSNDAESGLVLNRQLFKYSIPVYSTWLVWLIPANDENDDRDARKMKFNKISNYSKSQYATAAYLQKKDEKEESGRIYL